MTGRAPQPPGKKVLVAGAGAIGQLLGARLQAAGQAVTMLARPSQVAALNRRLVIHGHTTFDGPVTSVSAAADTGADFDFVVVTAKAHQTADIAPEVAPLLAPEGAFVSLQNGLGNEQKLVRFVPPRRLAIALTSHGVLLEVPGRVLHAGVGPTLVGPAHGAPPEAAQRALGLLADAGLAPQWQPDMRPAVWAKAIVNAGINPVAALNGARNGAVAADAGLLRDARALVREGAGVAAAAGVGLVAKDLVAAMEATLGRTAENKCSMLQDVERARPTEVEQITGRILRLGERLGAPVAATRDVYARVKALEAGYLGAARAQAMAAAEMAWETAPF